MSFLKTGYDTSLGLAAGAGLSFPIGKMFIIQPMVDLNLASIENNIFGLNLNIGISLGMRWNTFKKYSVTLTNKTTRPFLTPFSKQPPMHSHETDSS